MSGEEPDTARKSVKTYVPAYQKEIWQEHAEDLGMSQSEFVRSMVQAGRRDFDLDTGTTDTADATPSGERLEEQVLGILKSEGALGYEELLSTLIGEFEDTLEQTMQELQADNRIQHSPRVGGYRTVEARDEQASN